MLRLCVVDVLNRKAILNRIKTSLCSLLTPSHRRQTQQPPPNCKHLKHLPSTTTSSKFIPSHLVWLEHQQLRHLFVLVLVVAHRQARARLWKAAGHIRVFPHPQWRMRTHRRPVLIAVKVRYSTTMPPIVKYFVNPVIFALVMRLWMSVVTHCMQVSQIIQCDLLTPICSYIKRTGAACKAVIYGRVRCWGVKSSFQTFFILFSVLLGIVYSLN